MHIKNLKVSIFMNPRYHLLTTSVYHDSIGELERLLIKRGAYKYILKRLNKSFSMNSDSLTNFFEQYFSDVKKDHPTPTWISLHRARVHHRFTESVLRNLAKENIIRMQGEPPKFALEDILAMKKVREFFNKLEDADIMGKKMMEGESVYTIIDLIQSGKAVEAVKMKALQSMFNKTFGDKYKIVRVDEKKAGK